MDDFEAELDENVNAPASKKEATKSVDANNKAGFALRLDAEPKETGLESHSVGSTAQSSDDTASKK